MDGRRDPVVAAAQLVVAAQTLARQTPYARATVGRLAPVPGGTNVIASRVDLWLDVRHPDDSALRALVEQIRQAASRVAEEEGCVATMVDESYSPTVDFDPVVRDGLARLLDDAPVLATGAGHDAGVLKEHVRTAMLFVRNPTGISHSPHEHVEEADVEAGALALADCLEQLVTSEM
jgi:beta-ureidopropionase / N-carbamoyl-L-amino-acid hydrolase